MADSIHMILSPLLIISYVFGVKIVEFPASKPKLWFGSLYVLLLWSVYYFLLVYTAYRYASTHSTVYHICLLLEIFGGMLSIVLGLYHDKKYKNCLRKLTIVDDTLKKLEITTDYQELYTKVLLVVLGWLLFVMWKMYTNGMWYSKHCGLIKAVYVSFMLDYCSYLNLVDDLIIASILRYVEIKFDQINKYLQEWEKNDKYEISQKWNNLMLLPRQTVYLKSKSKEYMTWIIIHVHSELRKILHDFNSIFGLQKTFKIGTYFAFIALGFRGIFNVMLINNYVARPILFFIVMVTSLIENIFRVLLINYMCERVSVKASATGDLANRISCYSYNTVVRENILQLTLQLTQTPVRFCGIGFFQFGLKFLYGFCSSVATVVVILVQSHINNLS